MIDVGPHVAQVRSKGETTLPCGCVIRIDAVTRAWMTNEGAADVLKDHLRNCLPPKKGARR